MSKHLCSVVLLAAATIGCATADRYEKIVDSYVGSSEDALLAEWGPPDKVYTSDAGTKYLTLPELALGFLARHTADLPDELQLRAVHDYPGRRLARLHLYQELQDFLQDRGRHRRQLAIRGQLLRGMTVRES